MSTMQKMNELMQSTFARIATLEAERDTARAELASEREALRNVSDELQQVDEILSAAGRVRTAALRQMKDDLARKQRCIDAALQDYECDRGVHSMVSVLRPEATAKGEKPTGDAYLASIGCKAAGSFVVPAEKQPEPSGEKALRLAMGIIGVLLTSGTNRVDGSLLEPHKRQELKAIASEARGGA
mgnify:FL=1